MKSVYYIILMLLLPICASGQAKWELGGQLGFVGYQGDLNPNVYMDFNSIKPGYGIFLRRNLNTNFALRANYIGGQAAGDDKNFDDLRKSRGFNFKSNINELSVLFEYDILGRHRYKGGVFKKIFSPYIFVGVGIALVDGSTDYNPGTTWNPTGIATDKAATKPTTLPVAPFGLGIKLDLSEQWALGLEYGLRPLFNDYLDGVSQSGNAKNDDWYSVLSLNLAYRFGQKDTDNDGVPDKKDACPLIPGLVQFNGCPDTDGDGITDSADACPTVAGKTELHGCPDTDNDGIADKDDACPDIAGLVQFSGCPDTDEDGVMDKNDKCPTVKGPAKFNGCPDTDGDGIIDKEDKCPTEKGTEATGGCPDTDGDGIIDKDDKCPTIAGTLANIGCPELKIEDKAVIDLAVKSIQFENKSDQLKESSIPILDQLAIMLLNYPNYNVNISGHTDDKGKDSDNMLLSEKRAQKCVEYLINKGVNTKRLTAKGYGETKAIANNKTAEGRQMNRRVEFELVKVN